VIFGLLVVLAGAAMNLPSCRVLVNHTNVNNRWQDASARGRSPVGTSAVGRSAARLRATVPAHKVGDSGGPAGGCGIASAGMVARRGSGCPRVGREGL